MVSVITVYIQFVLIDLILKKEAKKKRERQRGRTVLCTAHALWCRGLKERRVFRSFSVASAVLTIV